jgi:arylsulfatase A
MSKKHILPLLGIGLICLNGAQAMAAKPEISQADRPNFVFFITDDQFKDMMNFLPEGEGNNLTPATDKLAKNATIMMNMYVTSPVCTPSRFACLTGTYPSRSNAEGFVWKNNQHGGQTIVEWNTFITKDDKHTLPWMLKRAGYKTGIVGKNHVITTPKIQHPQWEDDPTDPKVVELLRKNAEVLKQACKQAGFDYAASLYDNNPSHNGIKALLAHNQDWITKGALDFIDEYHTQPFFLWMATTVPHGPTDDARSWDSDPRITAEGLLDAPLDVQPSRASLAERVKIAGITGWQKENLLWMDDSLGALVQKLDELGELDNTIIIYFNDHGQRSKGTVYEGGVHSEAFFWKEGGFPVGHRSDAFVSNVDFAPTILDMAGVDYDPSYYDGVSAYPVLMGEVEQTRDSLYFELGFVRGVLKDRWKYIALRYPDNIANMPRADRQEALDKFNASQRRREKPVYTEDPMAPFSHIQAIPGGGDAEHASLSQYPAFYDSDQLYYLPDDKSEQVNLANDPAYAEKLAEMKVELQSYLKSLPGTFGELKPE